jgi:hypothetical protein
MHSEACSATRILEVLERLVPRAGAERTLAEDVQRALVTAAIDAMAESELTTGRVDLRVGTIAVELKVKGTVDAVLRQLERYAKDPAITEVILVTTSAKLRAMPAEVGGKRLHVVYLMRL